MAVKYSTPELIPDTLPNTFNFPTTTVVLSYILDMGDGGVTYDE